MHPGVLAVTPEKAEKNVTVVGNYDIVARNQNSSNDTYTARTFN